MRMSGRGMGLVPNGHTLVAEKRQDTRFRDTVLSSQLSGRRTLLV